MTNDFPFTSIKVALRRKKIHNFHTQLETLVGTTVKIKPIRKEPVVGMLSQDEAGFKLTNPNGEFKVALGAIAYVSLIRD